MTELLEQALSKVRQLSEDEQDIIAKMMLKRLEKSPLKRPPLFGSDKDIIAISDDFEQPLPDFEAYQ